MNEGHHPQLGGISPDNFLKKYWQKKPYLIRQAIPEFSTFIDVKDLFQLVESETVESRIVIEKGGEYPWQVIPGPIDNTVVTLLPDSHWSLLVQGVNLHNVQADLLLHQFSFIPNWRIDDLMVSYACKNGSVGPHVDNYDVFLLQAMGKRNWRISLEHYTEDDFLTGVDLRIIEAFTHDQEWDLNPGDMLYLPPGVAHHGVAIDECITYSIGFRAPTRYELLTGYLETNFDPYNDIQYQDPDMQVQKQPGEICPESLSRINKIMQSSLENNSNIDRWFGTFITTVPENYIPDPPVELIGLDDIIDRIGEISPLQIRHGSRTAFLRAEEGLLLYVNGREYLLPDICQEVIYCITGAGTINISDFDKTILEGCAEVLHDLYNNGELLSS